MNRNPRPLPSMVIAVLALALFAPALAFAENDTPAAKDRTAIKAKAAAAEEQARAGIDATNRKLEAAIAAGDGAAAAALYTKKGQLLPTGSEVITGTEAIAAFWQAGIDAGLGGVKLKTLEVEAHRGTAIEVGAYETRDAEGNVTDHGKFIVIWKKRDGAWKLHRDIWNSSVPLSE